MFDIFWQSAPILEACLGFDGCCFNSGNDLILEASVCHMMVNV